MPTRWETFPVELKGGMVTNLPNLQHGLQLPGSPRILRNFEPSLRGGYRRINGFTKYNETVVPAFGDVRVQGSGQSGTSLDLANVLEEPMAGDTLTIAGVTGTYTISAVTFVRADATATVTLSTSLASSPADKAAVTISNSGSKKMQGLWIGSLNGNLTLLAVRGGTGYVGSSGWTSFSLADYGPVKVDGGSQTGTSLLVKDNTSDPVPGDTFFIDGIELVYTVTAVSGQTWTITPSLDSSPSDSADITLLSHRVGAGSDKVRFEKFNYSGTDKVVMVDGTNYPFVYCAATCGPLNGSTDIEGAEHVISYKDHLFFSKSDNVYYSAPLDENDFDTANGAGTFRLPDEITGMIVFREQLVIFTEKSIYRVTGSSSSDFVLSVISNNLGCIRPDTIQEVGGDVLYLGPDGIRYLGATERIGDFNLALASRNIQTEIEEFIDEWSTFHTVTIRSKSQFRIFGFNDNVPTNSATGYLGTQFLDQNSGSIAWAELKSMRVYLAASNYVNGEEYIVFANDNGYVYLMDSGDDFDGTAIRAKMTTPHFSINDPTYRKTFYTLKTYYLPEGNVVGTIGLILDFGNPDKIQPSTFEINQSGDFSRYGEAIYGTDTYGGKPRFVFRNQLKGAGFQGGLEYNFTDAMPPFTLDSIVIEYATEERM